MQGIILSAYFYGQIVSPMISGVICRRYGVRIPMTIYVLLSSCLLILTPFAAKYGAWTVVLFRCAQGFFGVRILTIKSYSLKLYYVFDITKPKVIISVEQIKAPSLEL